MVSKEPDTLTADASIHDAARSLRKRDVGSLFVVRKGKPLDIVTEKDLVTGVVAEDRLPSEVPIESV